MRIKPILFLIIWTQLSVLLSGCLFVSEEQIIDDTERAVKDAFLADPTEATEETDSLSLYVPEKMDMADATEYNLVLQDGDQTYLLFFNPLEEDASRLLYESANKNDVLIDSTFQSEEQFGYVVAVPYNDDGQYELIVGLGGKRISTVSEKRNLAEDAGLMMEMVRSISYKQND
ncbi:hypothetical protein EDD68_11642 [Melghiribacillus thermohalophilus]|uniref:Uncharacterized protein n=1 Tax=Melghiribacillus thermohalophilus TaxID=1324956 RepID=A0A4R3MYT6_9BACI|nr:hypothetical protein [Melghiribacillus thermohalophilus]TCT19913.1 hypothetical protein EDD68_11642 [Melghiribacillus thermohalophilus]